MAMKRCPNPACPHRLRIGIAAEFQDDIVVCSDCATVLEDASDDAPTSAPRVDGLDPAIAGPLRRRLALTLSAPVLLLLGQRILLPNLDAGAIAGLWGSAGPPGLAGWAGARANLSILALGITPAVTAAVVVELAARALPWWRQLRDGHPEGRARLVKAAAVATLVLTLVQAYGLAMFVEAFQHTPGLLSRGLVILSLTTGTFLTLALAGVVRSRGLGNGFSVLLMSAFVLEQIAEVVRFLVSPDVEATPLLMAAVGLVAVFVVVATLRVLGVMTFGDLRRLGQRPPERGPAAGRAEEALFSYRTAPAAAAPATELPEPVSGVVPVLWASAVLQLPWTLANMGIPISGPPAALLDRDVQLGLRLALVVGFTVLGASWFNSPTRVAALRARLSGDAGAATSLLPQARADLRAATVRACGYLVAITLADELLKRLTHVPLDAVLFAMMTAVVVDSVAEWRARAQAPDAVAVWEEHRAHAVPAALRALAAQGIVAWPRAIYHRVLLQFFGPFVPIELMVPRDREKDARRVLYRVLFNEEPPAADSGSAAARPSPSPRNMKKPQKPQGAARAELHKGRVRLS